MKEKVTQNKSSWDRKELFQTTLYSGLSGILSTLVWQRTEFLFISFYLELSFLADYSIALSLVALSTEMLKLFPAAFLPYLSSLKYNSGLLHDSLFRFMKHFSWLVTFVCIFFAIEAESLIRIIYSENYTGSATFFRILILAYLPAITGLVNIYLLISMGKTGVLLFLDFLAAACFLTLSFLLTPHFGLLGVSWAKTSGIFVMSCSGFIYTSLKLKFSMPYHQMLYSIILAAMVLLPFSLFDSRHLYATVLKGVAGFGIYFIVSLRLRLIDSPLNYIGREWKSSLRKRLAGMRYVRRNYVKTRNFYHPE